MAVNQVTVRGKVFPAVAEEIKTKDPVKLARDPVTVRAVAGAQEKEDQNNIFNEGVRL